MAVFRIERTRDYTVMSNHHLRNGKLSLKAKGLLSMMLSLPEDWNYTTRGLAKICKEGVDAIGGALRELESAGYIVRHQMRDRQGRNVRADVCHAGVGMRVFMGMFMLMVMLVNMTACMCVCQRDVLTLLLRAVHGHGELRAADAALFGAHGRGDNAGDAQRIKLLQKCLRLRQQLEQRRREHIARSAHAAVKIQCFHGLAPI